MSVRGLTDGITVAGSGALLFAVEPMMAKVLLPRFGGSAGVWVACMMFFQIVLLLGYLYTFWITRWARPAARAAVHLALVAGSLAVLPLRPPVEAATGNPTLAIVLVLAASVGLPFFVLATTSPLVQAWHEGPFPYALFAISNAACLVALVAYPVAIEPVLTSPAQLRWWSFGYAAVAALLAIATVRNRGWAPHEKAAGEETSNPLLWIALAACPSAAWLGTANHLSQEVAAIPFLWVLPMSVYLLTFIAAFGWDGWYRPTLFRWLLPAGWIAIALRTGLGSAAGGLGTDMALTLAGLAIVCLFCHGELADRRPESRRGLPFYYLAVAGGGALGGVFVAIAAPALFSAYLELPIAVIGSLLLALPLVYGVTSRARLVRLGVLATAAIVATYYVRPGSSSVARSRNFYGVLNVSDSDGVRTMHNGRTVHGVEFLAPELRDMPASYYGPRSGIGRLFGVLPGARRRVAVVGLGAGTLAAYGRKGDWFRFYEINPAVVEAARADFHFLADSAATVDVATADGRLGLEHEPARSLDLIVLDAFSDDAIPVHLLTREAFQAYFARLRQGAPLAVHVTNRYLDLDPVLQRLAGTFSKTLLRIRSAGDAQQQTLAAEWAVMADPGPIADGLRPWADPTPVRAGPLWTDEYSNLLQIWR
jgi:hypothetical protein